MNTTIRFSLITALLGLAGPGLAAICTTAAEPAAAPVWFVEDVTDLYPDMILGRGCAVLGVTPEEALRKARADALHDAAERVLCRVESDSIQSNIAVGVKAEDCFVSATQVRSTLQVAQLQELRALNVGRHCYLLLGSARTNVTACYRRLIDEALTEIPRDFASAQKLAAADPRRALATLTRGVQAHIELQDNLRLYTFLGGETNSLAAALAALPTRQQFEERQSAVEGARVLTTPEIADALLQALGTLPAGAASFCAFPLRHEKFDIPSEFGQELADALANRLTARQGWQRCAPDKADWHLTGSIFPGARGAEVLIGLDPCHGGRPLAAQLHLNRATVEQIGERIKPRDFERILRDRLMLADSLHNDGALKVEVRNEQTLEDPDALVTYRYGATPTLSVRANRDCYIRLIYLTSDHKRCLLLDNHRLPSALANEWAPLCRQSDGKSELECCPPAGAEQLLLQACIEKMPDLETRRETLAGGGYIDWIESDLKKQIGQTRGLMKKRPDVRVTERLYNWTILP